MKEYEILIIKDITGDFVVFEASKEFIEREIFDGTSISDNLGFYDLRVFNKEIKKYAKNKMFKLIIRAEPYAIICGEIQDGDSSMVSVTPIDFNY